MGFNFRKRIRLGKYASINIGKSGLSLSVGRKGIRQSISTSGNARTTFSLPGTGLSYSKSINTKKIFKEIGNKPVFGVPVSGVKPDREVEEFNEDIRLITTLHQYEDYPKDIDWNEIANEEIPFGEGEEGPHVKKAKEMIEASKPGFFKRIFASGGFKKESQSLLEEAKKMEEEVKSAWEHNKVIAEKMMHHDKEAYLEVLEDLKISEELGYYLERIDFSYLDDDSLHAEIELKIDTFIPEEYKTLTPTGRLSVRKYTKTDYYEVVNLFVSGITLRIARNLLNLIPVEDMVLDIYELRKSPYSGASEKIRILSILIDRRTFENINLTTSHPFEVLKEFHHEVSFGKMRGFQSVEPIRK